MGVNRTPDQHEQRPLIRGTTPETYRGRGIMTQTRDYRPENLAASTDNEFWIGGIIGWLLGSWKY